MASAAPHGALFGPPYRLPPHLFDATSETQASIAPQHGSFPAHQGGRPAAAAIPPIASPALPTHALPVEQAPPYEAPSMPSQVSPAGDFAQPIVPQAPPLPSTSVPALQPNSSFTTPTAIESLPRLDNNVLPAHVSPYVDEVPLSIVAAAEVPPGQAIHAGGVGPPPGNPAWPPESQSGAGADSLPIHPSPERASPAPGHLAALPATGHAAASPPFQAVPQTDSEESVIPAPPTSLPPPPAHTGDATAKEPRRPAPIGVGLPALVAPASFALNLAQPPGSASSPDAMNASNAQTSAVGPSGLRRHTAASDAERPVPFLAVATASTCVPTQHAHANSGPEGDLPPMPRPRSIPVTPPPPSALTPPDVVASASPCSAGLHPRPPASKPYSLCSASAKRLRSADLPSEPSSNLSSCLHPFSSAIKSFAFTSANSASACKYPAANFVGGGCRGGGCDKRSLGP